MTAICNNCNDDNWVCELHADKPWDDGEGCCGAAGMPCPVCNIPHGDNPPRMPEGTSIFVSKNGSMN